MSWIKTTSFEESEGKLRGIYKEIADDDGYLDNIIMVHGERPHTLEGHLKLYKSVMHDKSNKFSAAWRETIAVYVSLLNQCDYCLNHHLENLHKKVTRQVGEAIYNCLKNSSISNSDLSKTFSEKQVQMLGYVKILTLLPVSVTKMQIERIKKIGVSDGEILELNQLVGYFSYANRMALGLGLTNKDEKLGWEDQMIENEVASL